MSRSTDSGSACALAGFNVLSFTITRPFLGVPIIKAELDVAEEPAPTGAQQFTFTAPAKTGNGTQTLSFPIAIIESRAHIGRATVYAVSGAGGLRATLPGRDYGEVAPRLVVEDVLAAEEDADGDPRAVELADDDVLAALDELPHLPNWRRPAGSGSQAMRRVAERFGLAWRVLLETGKVWIGEPVWEAWKGPDGGQPYYIEEPNAAGIAVIALDAPDLAPGQTILPPDDQPGDPLRVSDVIHTMSEEGVFRTTVRIMPPDKIGATKGRTRSNWDRAVLSALPPQDLRVPWRATVVTQDDDGLLGLRLEEGAPLLTLSGVPIWPGWPGLEVRVPGGVECIVEFIGGRETDPIVRSFAPESDVELIRFDGGDSGFSRVGDSVNCGTVTAMAGAIPVIFTYSAPDGSTSDPIASANLSGVITSGSPKFKGQ